MSSDAVERVARLLGLGDTGRGVRAVTAVRGFFKCAVVGTALACAIVGGAVLAGIDYARSEWRRR